MPINGSDLINQPWNTTFSPYINLFGQGWIIIPASIIAAIIFMRTRDPVILAFYMIATGGMLSAGGMFLGFIGGGLVYLMFSAIGIAVLLYNLFYTQR